jgi:tetratricopeptide (TPR) repeat protein
MYRQVAHARGWFLAGLLALAFAAPGAVSAAPAVTAPTLKKPARTLAPLRVEGADLAASRLRSILYADRWNRARSLYELGDYLAAASYYMALVNEPIDPRSLYEVRFRLAECLFFVGAYPGAVRYFRLVMASDPNGKYTAQANARLSELNVRLGVIAEARARYAAAGAAGAERSNAAYTLGHALAPMGVTEAAFYLAEVAPATRFFAEAQYHLGALAAPAPPDSAGYATAVTYFEQARAALPAAAAAGPGADPGEAGRLARLQELISLSLARVYADAGRFTQALDEYGRVPAGGRYRDVALLESAWVLLTTDQVLPALENVQTLLRELPESPRILEAALLVGYLTIEQGKFNSAYGHFEDTRRLLENLDRQLSAYAASQTEPESFYQYLVEARDGPKLLPGQIAAWVREGDKVKESNSMLGDLRDVEREIRDLYRRLDEIEVQAAGPRGGPGDPAWNDGLVRLELSNALYRLQQRILLLRMRPFVRLVTDRESNLLRLMRRVRSDLIAIRYTPADLNAADARRQIVLSQLAQYLLQIHPEIGLDTVRRTDDQRVAEVEQPLWADDFLRDSRRGLAELSRDTTLDDRWLDAAIEYTVYLEDRLQAAVFRRLRVDERFDAVKRVSVLFRQSVELQHTLRQLGDTLAGIQESILLDIRARSDAERKLLTEYQGAARDIDAMGKKVRGMAAQDRFAKVATDVAQTAVLADLGALDTGWRVKELEDLRVRELLSEKQVRLGKLEKYYAEVASTSAGPGPYSGVEDLDPERLAQTVGSVDSPYGRELLELGREVVELARALQQARLQQEQLAAGAEPAVLSPEELAVERARREAAPKKAGLPLKLDREPVPGGTKGLPVKPVKPGERP